MEDDVAHVNWGGSWRTPTKEEWDELIEECDWSWTGSGYNLTGPNGQSIFLPAAGCQGKESTFDVGTFGYYWSSSLLTDRPYGALSVRFFSGDHNMGYGGRCYGLSVRPVTP